MSKELFLVSVLSMAMFATGASFASDDTMDMVNQNSSANVPLTKMNTTYAQRKAIISDHQKQIKNLQRQMDQIHFDYTLENEERTKKLEAMEKQINSLRLEIHNLE